jgi:hypothetical protein
MEEQSKHPKPNETGHPPGDHEPNGRSYRDRDDDEVVLVGDRLNKVQKEAVAQLNALATSLRGPQAFLETAGHFTRPPFPGNGARNAEIGVTQKGRGA